MLYHHKAMKTCLNSYKCVWILRQGLGLSPHIPRSMFGIKPMLTLWKCTQVLDQIFVHSFLCYEHWVDVGFIFHCYSQHFAQGASFAYTQNQVSLRAQEA
jgi:hypothetical protein